MKKMEMEFRSNSDNSENIQCNEQLSQFEETRKKNIEELHALLKSIRDPELEQEFALLNQEIKPVRREKVKTKSRKRETVFKWSGVVRVDEIRKSSRLQNKVPQYKEDYLENIEETVRSTYFKNLNRDINYVYEDYKPKNKPSIHRRVEKHVFIPVEDVSQDMLDNIALSVQKKVYSVNGTTCHQCRQKTLDQKTCCRNPECTGMQGMLCGVCIKNRYGEDAAVALKDPNWHCFVCRKICNCSICRNRQGKRPTGILVPLCKQQGFNSVKDFLISLRGEGDDPNKDLSFALERDVEALLGFLDNGRVACLNNKKWVVMVCKCCLIKDSLDPNNLVGFSQKGLAVYGNGHIEELRNCVSNCLHIT
ncbi:cell division cycle-associated protein 7-like isoform X2 [Cylas formicarius]|uniref:cell division cycle-associated protein 7-like isoform X2 n=1 Tax=Cylas formicarius TaxID=197179 RepID=UPI0029587B09|nr:cell division cycle-associated protein 7-like isoform X2 [Cylas formicarius]